MSPFATSSAVADVGASAEPRTAASPGPAWDRYSPLSADNMAARDAVFQLLSLRRSLQQLGRAGASTLLAGMALAATGGPVEVRYAPAYECPPTISPTTSSWRA